VVHPLQGTACLAAAVLLGWTVPGSPQPPVAPAAGQTTPVFGAAVELVRIDALVLDKDGRPVTGLTQSDFEVEEGGRLQTITSFEPVVVRGTRPAPAVEPPRLSAGRLRPPTEGRCLLLYFDDVHVRQASIERVRQALRRFVEQDLREGDWVTVVAPEQEVWWTARNAWEYRQLGAVIERLKGQGAGDSYADWQALRALESGLSGATGGRAVMAGGATPAGGAPAGGQPASGRARSERPTDEAVAGVGSADASFLGAEMEALVKRRTGMTLGGLRQALESLVPLHGHKSLVMISEGFLMLPGMPGYQEAIDVARRANVAIHFLDPRALETGLADASTPSGEGQPRTGVMPGTQLAIAAGEAEGIAFVTGGHAFGSTDAGRALRQVAAEAEAYYLLGYSPENAKKGERRVKVRVKREGLKVLARSRYFVADPAQAAATAATLPAAAGVSAVSAASLPSPSRKGEPLRTPADAAALGAMRSLADTTDVPLRLSTFFFEPSGQGEVATLLATEVVPPPAPAGERVYKVISEARPREGGTPARDQFEISPDASAHGPLILARQWHLPPGVWQVRLLVEETVTGRIGTAIHTFEVPDPAAFRLSTPILTGELDDPNGRRKPRLTLGRTFRSGSIVYCQYSVYGAPATGGDKPASRVLGSWTLRRGGDVVRETPPTLIQPAPDGRVTRTLGIGLQGAPPGEYALELTARDEKTGESLTRTEPFTVAP
jgi:VWFA-related protein